MLTFLRQVHVFFFGGEICLCCGMQAGIIPLCSACQKRLYLQQAQTERCSICGKELLSEIEICSSCRRERVLFSTDKAFPLHSYRFWEKSLLFEWKIEEKRALSPLFASLVFEKLKSISPDSPILPVVPVPPRPKKIKHKGWDQIDEMCFYLKNLYGVKIYKILQRVSSYQQKKLNRQERIEKSQKSFCIKTDRATKKILANPPETVVLVDDVMTTGSTIDSCAKELKRFGVQRVFVITVFIVD
ncbi:ComF family protein [Treponema pectinovorum]|uniref:ComF family protein n=1 Tax=Treponema pectinovorum TaxID=164 RepID=UPI0011C93628|nr:phosphoribosyltransferase family protein [Treponema pectinovorum]